MLWTVPSSNRTFMELKFCYLVFARDDDVRSNRTFMELKFDYALFLDGELVF